MGSQNRDYGWHPLMAALRQFARHVRELMNEYIEANPDSSCQIRVLRQMYSPKLCLKMGHSPKRLFIPITGQHQPSIVALLRGAITH
jgi:hypothetical protein